jgi:hypothetical protein
MIYGAEGKHVVMHIQLLAWTCISYCTDLTLYGTEGKHVVTLFYYSLRPITSVALDLVEVKLSQI